MKKTHTIYIKHYILTLFSITFFTFSCTKQENVNDTPAIDIPNGYAAIQVEMAGIQFDEEKLGDIKKAAVRINNSQQKTATNNSAMSCTASLEPISTTSNINAPVLKGNNKLAVLNSREVEKDIRYRVYAYDKTTGDLATSKSYIRGKENEAGPLLVFGGKQYTIVAYSINSKTTYPAEIETPSNINTATIPNGQVEFMFQKQDITVAHNSNSTIKLKFKYQFAQINTIIKLDNSTRAYASIRGAGGASYFKPSYSKTKFKVSNSTIMADNADLNVLGTSVTFPFIPFTNLSTYEITNIAPTILNTPTAITNGKFTIESLTIGDISRRVDVENLNLLPGVKYNLVLTFNVPETTIIGANPYFHFYDVTTQSVPFTHTVNLENPTFGAQIDIWYLDNSFNLKINGVNLFSKELNFEGFPDPLHDVYFSDNTYYGSADIPSGNISVIYRINESSPRQQIPVVRLTFDENGNVRLFGRKRMTANLRELFIRPTITINPLAKLNPNGNNTLIFSSTRWTITDVEGRVYGIRVVN